MRPDLPFGILGAHSRRSRRFRSSIAVSRTIQAKIRPRESLLRHFIALLSFSVRHCRGAAHAKGLDTFSFLTMRCGQMSGRSATRGRW